MCVPIMEQFISFQISFACCVKCYKIFSHYKFLREQHVAREPRFDQAIPSISYSNIPIPATISVSQLSTNAGALDQCFSTAGPRPVTSPWHQLYRAARGSPGSCHFSFLSIFSRINIL
jgi:hypothetical protein